MALGSALVLSNMVGCGEVGSSSGTPDAMPRMCAPTAKFGSPVEISELRTVDGHTPRLSADELTIYFYTVPQDLWSAHRRAVTEAFGTPTLLGGQNSPAEEYDPSVSSDGLTLWFASDRVADVVQHLYVSTRTSTLVDFGPPGLAATVNAMDTKQFDSQPFLTADGKELWFTSTRAGGLGGFDIWRAARVGSEFATPVSVPELNSSTDDWVPTPSADRLTIYFSSARMATGVKGQFDIWTSHRDVVDDGFPAPTLVDELNTAGSDFATWLSADNCRIYGVSDRFDGVSRIYMATRQP